MTYSVYIKPNSKKGPLVEVREDGVLIVFVRERAVDGKANEALVKVLAEYLDVSKSHLRIKSGLTSRKKLVEVQALH